jgi:hypothetical protein
MFLGVSDLGQFSLAGTIRDELDRVQKAIDAAGTDKSALGAALVTLAANEKNTNAMIARGSLSRQDAEPLLLLNRSLVAQVSGKLGIPVTGSSAQEVKDKVDGLKVLGVPVLYAAVVAGALGASWWALKNYGVI